MSGPAQEFGSPGAGELVDAWGTEWSRFVAGHPDATCFHQPAWLATLCGAYGFRALVAVQRDTAGTLLAGLPLIEVRRPTGTRRWSCLPFSDECGPLVAPGGSAAALLSQVDALRRARGVAELDVRTGCEFPGARSRQVAVTHALALTSAAGDGGRLPRPRGSVRRHIATARRLGVQVRAAEEVGEVVDTYYRLHVETRRRQGVPAQPRGYFRVLWDRVLEPGGGFVLIARHGGTAVAGAVYLIGGRTVTYKYGASDSRAWSVRPNHAVMAEAIAWATERQYATFDLGRTDLDNPGLVQFKESWGAETRPLCYTSSSGRVDYRAGSAAHAVLASLIRRSPTTVCRGLGELLYRYAA
ncbi:lipid II:glycine glycyltransferase FemX [Geodermatophilus maliterrae]|uniref:Lipid II:glycine glycyltransferase FemX n=1 Tax=Geodermatophilus maliterrae TaxID=3162531 RepID=A0ABV3XD79_9ACTN